MTYAEAIQFLYGLSLFGAEFGLGKTRRLAALAGNPQDRLRFIHVAGTNGKGSTCAMLESIYRAAGLRVGLFTSPHLVSFRERIQVDRQLISEAEVVRLVGELREHRRTDVAPVSVLDSSESKAENGDRRDACPTFFEFVTVMALRHFAEQKCGLVIWETGLGGRLDATNIVTPLASVITNIDLDHQQWLGDTLAKIAAEKAGIIKPHIPVLTATDEREALAVIETTARNLQAPLTHVTTEHVSRFTFHASLPLCGDHQQLNAALAIATVKALQNIIPVNEAAIRGGLETVQWPGRLQLVTRPGGQKILLDGAHNIAGMHALAGALRKHFPEVKPALVLGMLQDKEWSSMCARLAPLASRIVCVPLGSERTAAAAGLASACRLANPAAQVTTSDSGAAALHELGSAPFVLVTGSLYLVGEALESLQISPVPATDEKALNDWVAGRKNL